MKKFKMRLYRAYNNVFGKIGGALLCGGLLCVCCNALPAGLTMLAFSGLSLLFCAGKLYLEDVEVEREKKYYKEPEAEEYVTEEKVNEKNLVFEEETKILNTQERTK